MNTPIYIPMSVAVNNAALPMSVAVNTATFELSSAVKVVISDAPEYHGATEVTPTQSTQVLNTNGYVLRDNITVNPIPSNYGLITWNGSILTVS